MTTVEAQKSLRTSFRAALTKLSPRDFTPVSRLEDIVNAAYFDSRHWMRLIFGEARDPDSGSLPGQHFYYIWRGVSPGFDLLQHRYTLDSRTVVVSESIGIIQVAVRLNAADQALHLDPASRASKIANSLLQLPSEIHFVPDPSAGWLVSSTENPEPEIVDWKQRIYAFATDSTVEIFIYKEDPMLRPAAPNYSIWFDAEFRKHPPQPAR